jgi:hypothetical protein
MLVMTQQYSIDISFVLVETDPAGAFFQFSGNGMAAANGSIAGNWTCDTLSHLYGLERHFLWHSGLRRLIIGKMVSLPLVTWLAQRCSRIVVDGGKHDMAVGYVCVCGKEIRVDFESMSTCLPQGVPARLRKGRGRALLSGTNHCGFGRTRRHVGYCCKEAEPGSEQLTSAPVL